MISRSNKNGMFFFKQATGQNLYIKVNYEVKIKEKFENKVYFSKAMKSMTVRN